MRRRVLVVGLAVLVLVGVVFAGRAVWQRWDRTPLQEALGYVDAKAMRVSFTDWKQVRADVDAGTNVEEWIARGFERDLIAASSIDGSADALSEHFGFSPENADWEVFSQSREGAAMVLRLDDADFGEIAAKLTEAGFEEPGSDSRVWKGGVDLVASLDGTLTPEVQYVALLEDQGVVVTSDTFEYAAQMAALADGEGSSLGDDSATYDMAGHVGAPDAAVLWAGDFACEDLSMSTASADDQQLASQLIAEAGEITPVTGVVIALDDKRLTVAEQFPDADQARLNLTSRAKLAVGPAVGRSGGTFADELELVSSTASGATMVLEFKALGDYPLSRHYDGALVFASC